MTESMRTIRNEAAFRKFHAENPIVYSKLVDRARRLVDAGHKKIGIGMLFEVLRWEHMLVTNAIDFKLNNNYRAAYARLIMENCPDLEGVFDVRLSYFDDPHVVAGRDADKPDTPDE